MSPTDEVMTGEEYAFPLSFAQARLWFLDQLLGATPMYNLSSATRLHVAVDPRALRRAVGLLVERHESLRTVFRVVGGEPRQVVLPVVRVPLEAHDLRRLPPAQREETTAQLVSEFAVRPFDLAVGPLIRTALLWLDEREFVLLVGVHHVVADGWSVGVLSRELGEVYGDLVGGGDGRVLAPLVVQYVDFAVWQRERLAGEWLVGELGWWRGALDGLSGLALPTDRARPAVQGHRGAGFGFVVDRAVVESVGVVARGSSATSFMVALAVWAVVLGRWCGQDEVVVGAPIAGRDRAELEGLIGFFVNTLVLRVDVSGDPTFAELVGRVREVALGAYAHAEVPFEKLVEELAPQRDLSRNPLFQVTFQLFDSPAAEGGIGDGLEIPVSSSLFDIRVDMWPAAGGWAGRVEFDSDLFERASIEALIDRFVWLLGEAAADPRRRIGSWALLPDEHRRLLQQWNDTAAAVPAITVIDAFAEQVTVNADREAVSDDEGTWTYRQLDDESRIVARRLGDARGQVIAVCLPRGRRFAAAALGVMRAGAAYLPLDPAYPTARLSYILAHADADAVITTDDLASQLDLPAATTPITTYTDHTDQSTPSTVTPDDLAYVIYTSGSTGEPKGVEIEHHSLTNLCHWHTTTYHTTVDDRATQIASVGFDAAVWELWPYLTCGASVHTVTDHTRNDPDLLIDWLHTHHITITFIPTPLAETLLDHPWPPNSPLRYLLTGGDTLHHHPNPDHPYTLINHYGPTETTVVATATTPGHRPDPGTPGHRPDPGTHGIPPTTQPPTIGHPITNTTITIIDPAGQPAGPHQPGELTIEGPTLARGYHHDPTLTHQRFTTTPGHRPDPGTAHPDTTTPGHRPDPARRYHTGDLARWNHDGTITYLGRTDHQLKIRGHRIEPAELETIITTHPNITHTTITTHTTTPGHRPDPRHSWAPPRPGHPPTLRLHHHHQPHPHTNPTARLAGDAGARADGSSGDRRHRLRPPDGQRQGRHRRPAAAELRRRAASRAPVRPDRGGALSTVGRSPQSR